MVRRPWAWFGLLAVVISSHGFAQEPARPTPPLLSAEDAEQIAKLQELTDTLRNDGHYGDALVHAKQVLEIRAKSQPADWWEVAEARRWVGYLEFVAKLGADEQAELKHAVHLVSKAEELKANGDYTAAEEELRKSLPIQARILGEEHEEVVLVRCRIASLLTETEHFSAAEALLRKSLATLEHQLPAGHPSLGDIQSNLGLVLYSVANFAEAEKAFRAVVASHEIAYGRQHSSVASALENAAGACRELAKFEAAEEYYLRSIGIRRKLGDRGKLANTLVGLADVFRRRGDFTKAEPLCREALQLQRELLPAGHPNLVIGLNGVASVIKELGKHREAEQHYREALSLCREKLGVHGNTATLLNNLALLVHRNLGDHLTAEPLYREALDMCKKIYSRPHPQMVFYLRNLAMIHRVRANYAEAERLLQESASLQDSIYSDEHPEVARTLTLRGGVACDVGDYAQGEVLHRQALELYRKVSDGDALVARGSTNLGAALFHRGDLEGAETHYREALAIYDRLGTRNRTAAAQLLVNLGKLRKAQGKHTEAEAHLREALAIHSDLLGAQHTSVAHNLYNLGTLLVSKGDYPDAEKLLKRAIDILEGQRVRVPGTEEQRARYAQRLQLGATGESLADVLVRQRKYAAAFDTLERIRGRALLDLLARSQTDLVREARAGSSPEESERLQKAIREEESATFAVGLAESELARAHQRTDLEAEALAALRDEKLLELKSRRARLRAATMELFGRLREFQPDARPLPVSEVRARLAADEAILSFSWHRDGVVLLTLPAAGAGELRGRLIANSQESVEELRRLVSAVRNSLTERPEGTAAHAKWRDQVDQLSRRLFPREATAELLSARRWIVLPHGPLADVPFDLLTIDASTSRRSLSVVGIETVVATSAAVYLNRRQRSQAIDRGAARTALILGDPIFTQAKAAWPDHGSLITQVVADSKAAQAGLRGGDVVVRYANTDVTDTAALQAALAESESLPQETQLVLSYWRQGSVHETTVPPGPLAVQLDQEPVKMGIPKWIARSRSADQKIAAVSQLDAIRLHGESLASLPGTRREAEAIAALLESAKLLLGDEATLPNLEANVGGHSFVHLATHGFTGAADRPYDASLALTRPRTPSTDDFGFLTLDRLVRKWRGKLSRTDLVVLSACDTRQGVNVGDSSMALPWGFFYAGAPTVIASLWKVDDTAASLLMARLYANLLGAYEGERQIDGNAYAAGKPLPKLAALREAQKWLRTRTVEDLASIVDSESIAAAASRGTRGRTKPTPATKGSKATYPYAHPHYWAVFVLVGSPD